MIGVTDLLLLYGSNLIASPYAKDLTTSFNETDLATIMGGVKLTDIVQTLVDFMNHEVLAGFKTENGLNCCFFFNCLEPKYPHHGRPMFVQTGHEWHSVFLFVIVKANHQVVQSSWRYSLITEIEAFWAFNTTKFFRRRQRQRANQSTIHRRIVGKAAGS